MFDKHVNKIVLLSDQLEVMKRQEIDQCGLIDFPSSTATRISDDGCDIDNAYRDDFSSATLSPISLSQEDDPMLSMILSPEIDDNDVSKCENTPDYSPASILEIVDELQCNIKQRPIYYSLQEMKKEISQHIFPVRADMCNWSFQVTDNYHIDREAVFLAFSYADRYVAQLDSMISSDEYTLLCMTSLYIAMKVIVHSKKKISLNWFVDMSRSAFTSDEFRKMEVQILHKLNWKLHPPTAISFLRLYMDSLFLSKSLSIPIKQHSKEYYFSQCRIYSECSIHDNFLSTIRPSIVALASIYLVLNENNINFQEEYEDVVLPSLFNKDLKVYHYDVMQVRDYLLSICDFNDII